MTEQKSANAGSKRRPSRRRVAVLAAAATVLLAAGGVGFAWYYDYGSAYAQVISPLHDDNSLERMIPKVFWHGMPRKDLISYTEGGLLVVDDAASGPSTIVGSVHDWRKWFRPRHPDIIRIEIDLDENDKVVATRWSRREDS